MSLRSKLLVIVCFVALVPLSVSAFTALAIHQRAFDRTIDEAQTSAAHYGAALARARLDDIERTLRLAVRSIPWDRLSAAERDGALWLVYQQFDDIVVASLLDGGGAVIGSPALLDAPTDEDRFAAHPVATPAVLERVAAAVPVAKAATGKPAMGPAVAGADGAPIVPIAVPAGESGAADLIVAVAVSLRDTCAELGRLGAGDLEVLLLDADQRVLCAAEPELRPAGAGLTGAVAAAGRDTVEYRAGDGTVMVAAVAELPRGWHLVTRQPRAAARAAGDEIRRQTYFWIVLSVLVALGAGLYLARGILRPVQELTRGAQELARGNLSYRLAADQRDELGQLAAAFNQMGAEIERRNAEIETWNRELEERVADRTRELKQAQKQLLQSEKIAAVSSLAAGVAHEINNPLTGVLGLAQVLRARAESDGDDRRRQTLATIESEAARIGDIVRTLLSFSSEHESAQTTTLAAADLIEGTLAMVSGQLADAGVELELELASGLAVRGNESQLRQALLHIVNNAVAAMRAGGGTLSVTTTEVEGELVKIIITDTGKGIAAEHLDRVFEPFFTTKDVWQGRGLGLTVAYRVIDEHRGTIHLASELGRGTTVTITLPVAKGGAHLV